MAPFFSPRWTDNRFTFIMSYNPHPSTTSQTTTIISPQQLNQPPTNGAYKPPCYVVKGHETSVIRNARGWSLCLVSVLWIDFDCARYFYATICIFLLNIKMLYRCKKQVSCLHPYLPIMVASWQRPLFSVPKVAVVKKFDGFYLFHGP